MHDRAGFTDIQFLHVKIIRTDSVSTGDMWVVNIRVINSYTTRELDCLDIFVVTPSTMKNDDFKFPSRHHAVLLIPRQGQPPGGELRPDLMGAAGAQADADQRQPVGAA